MADIEQAKNVLPGLHRMLESDLMKTTHYMKKGVAIYVVAEDTEAAEDMAAFHVELNDLLERYQKRFTRKIVD